MRLLLASWFISIGWAQMLLVDRGITKSADTRADTLRLRRTHGPGFVGDHFQVGAEKEVWIIDSIRTWAITGAAVDRALKAGDIFDKIIFFGGIEATPPPPGQPPQPECDCHNLMPIKTAAFRSGADRPDGDGSLVSPRTNSIWQIEMRNLQWSVPGGAELQFGVMLKGRGAHELDNYAERMDSQHPLKIFDDKGKLEGPDPQNELPLDPSTGINIQVWGHKSAPVTIRSAGTSIEVVLHSNRSFDAAKAAPASLRFGPKSAAPAATRLENSDGQVELVAIFRRSETGILPIHVNACLTGRQKDEVPFEGCDLLKPPSAK